MTSATVGDLCRRFGLTPRAVRYYEERDLIPTATRDRKGHRRFAGEVHEELALIVKLRRAGVGLDEIREIRRRRELEGKSGQQALIRAKLESRLRALEAERAAVHEALRAVEPGVSRPRPQPAVVSAR